MDNIYFKVKAYLEANSKTESEFSNILLQDDGSGAYIKTWNVLGLAQPTDEQLNAVESEATTLKSNYQVIKTRKSLYGTPEQQIENIMENGLDAEIARVNQIKSDNPKG